MALVTSGEDDILALHLELARTGPWVAVVLFDDLAERTGKVSLSINDGALVLNGTIVRGGEFEDTDRTRIVAGAGGLGKNGKQKQYTSPSVRIVLADLLSAAGETLSATASQSVLATVIPAWTTGAEPIGPMITALLATAAPTATWRMLPDGTLWVGVETWPDSELDPDTYQILDKRFEDGSWLVAVEAPALLPGTTFEGQRVSHVQHIVDDGQHGSRMRVWFADAAEPPLSDRISSALARVVSSTPPPPVDYRAMYWATVVSQSGSTIHVQPEIGTLPDMGSIPLLMGLPGAGVDNVVGGRVLIGWRGGDRAKAYAMSFDADTTVSTIVLAVVQMLFLGGKAGAQSPPLGTNLLVFLDTLVAGIISAGGTAQTAEQWQASTGKLLLAQKVSVA